MKKALIPVIIFGLMIAGLAWALLKGDTKTLSFAMEGKIIPDFEHSELYDDNRILTAQHVKGEITLINVFGTWCPPCAVEHPEITRIAQTGQARVVGLAWQRSYSREEAQRWLGRLGDPYDFVIFVNHGGLVSKMGVVKAPETYLLDQDGRFVFRHDGIMTAEAWETEFRPRIAALEAK